MGDENQECSKVFTDFLPCIRYVSGNSHHRSPTLKCCQGVRKLNEKAKRESKGSRKICQCLEDIAYSMNIPFVHSQVAALPSKCNVKLSFPISNSMDCSK
ncbi:protein ARABIDOPSIS THALIANA ANTHER 7 [Ricinus communis]|nr:protein ARABIDOPSIS THALIANA ANTHER 7 [Ricinus communis]|eukprot:XP_002517877.2 protein ARABIDOPSIS THALIANA ANTHER 7 [Ricinus communis]